MLRAASRPRGGVLAAFGVDARPSVYDLEQLQAQDPGKHRGPRRDEREQRHTRNVSACFQLRVCTGTTSKIQERKMQVADGHLSRSTLSPTRPVRRYEPVPSIRACCTCSPSRFHRRKEGRFWK